jgi:protoporphyrinogen IX oxidase
MLYLKALHIIFVVTWFAGLFYIVRLFVYHSEAQSKPEPEKTILSTHFKIASRRLWYGITWPSAILTYVFGTWFLVKLYGNIIPDWMWLKLSFVLLLTIYHLMCHRIFRNFQRDKITFTSMQLRLWNEVATVFLVAIVFIVVTKDLTNWMWGLSGMLVFSLALLAAIKIYKGMRKS